MTQQNFTLLTLAICMLTVNVFAQKNTNIQPQVKAEQPQSKVVVHAQRKEVKPLYQRVTKVEAKAEKSTSKRVAQPKFGSVARPNIYTNLDANIQEWEQKVTAIKADPNQDENTLIKHKATLERLREIKAQGPKGE